MMVGPLLPTAPLPLRLCGFSWGASVTRAAQAALRSCGRLCVVLMVSPGALVLVPLRCNAEPRPSMATACMHDRFAVSLHANLLVWTLDICRV